MYKMAILGATFGAAASLLGVPAAQAQPLIPPTAAEMEYLDQARRVLPLTDDSVAFNSDGELLNLGRYACGKRKVGQVGANVTYVPPVISTLAFIYLCPQ